VDAIDHHPRRALRLIDTRPGRRDDWLLSENLKETPMHRNGFALPPEGWKHGKPRPHGYPEPRQ